MEDNELDLAFALRAQMRLRDMDIHELSQLLLLMGQGRYDKVLALFQDDMDAAQQYMLTQLKPKGEALT